LSYSPIMMLEQDVANHLKAFASVNMLQEEEAGKTYYTNPGSIFGPIVPQVDCKVEEILLSRAYARVRIVVLNMLPYDIAEVPNAAGDAASFETFLDEYKNIESPLASEGYNFNTPNTHPSTLHKRPARLLYELADRAQDVYKNHDDFITDQSTMGTEVCITASVTTDAIPGSASDTRGVTIFVLLEEEHTVTQAEEDAGHAGDILSGLDGGPFG